MSQADLIAFHTEAMHAVFAAGNYDLAKQSEAVCVWRCYPDSSAGQRQIYLDQLYRVYTVFILERN